jgi:integrase
LGRKRAITIRERPGRPRPHMVCWRDPHGRKCEQGCTTREQAEALREEMLAALAKQQQAEAARLVPAPRGADGPTLAAFRPEWEKKYTTGLKTSTKAFYTYLLDDYLVPMLGTVPIGESSLTRGTVLDLIADLHAKGCRRATVVAVLRCLSTMLSGAIDLGLRTSNPCFRMGKRIRQKGDAGDPQPNPLSKADAEAFLGYVATHFPEWYAYFLCALRTGLRVGELAALKWSEVDLERAVANIRRNYSPRDGEDIDPKNHKARVVDLSPQLVRALEAERTAQRRAALAGGRRARQLPYVFLTRDGRQVRQDGQMRTIFDRAMAGVHLQARAHTPHDLRDTYATLHLQEGTTPEYVAAQLGHQDVSTTLRRYVRWRPNDRSALYAARLDSDRAIPATEGGS